jgi:hypothetical protein
MPARLSLKLVLVVAAVAFVAAFRLHAGGDDGTSGATAAATTLSPAQVSALRSDAVVRRPVSKPVRARLGAAPGLPALHRAPARPHRAPRSAPRSVAVAAPTAVPTPAATAAPVVTAAPRVAPAPAPAAPAPASPGYVGKSFDSKG